MSKRYFEFSEGTSNKFWEVWMEGSKVLTRYGKIGASGQTTVKDEGSPAGAQKLHDKLVREKTGKGYEEKNGGGGAQVAAAPAAAAPKAAKPAAAAPTPAPRAAASAVVVEPGFRRFEFSEGSSNKFWEVKVEGEQQIVRYGKIGTAGQEKEKDFESAAEAKADTKKLIAEKTGKGYVEVGVKKTPSNPELEAAIAANPDDAKNWRVYADWLLEQGEPWAEVIALALQGKPDKKRQDATAKELVGELEETTLTWNHGVIAELDSQPGDAEQTGIYASTIEKILRHPAGHLVQKISLGLPPDEDLAWHFDDLIEAISAAGPLPLLRTLDLSSDADHMDQPSWRRVGDLSNLWAAAPHLKELLLQGARGSDDGTPIDFGDLDAPELEKLIFISGGLDKKAPTAIGSAKLPKLSHLELYFGADDYGNDCTVGSLKGILDGSGLPALKTLGLKNSPWEEDLLKAIFGSKVLPRLEVLDLSMGVLADKAAAALQANAPKLKHLKKLILTDNYFSEADVAALKKALPNAEIGEQKDDEDPEYRYTTIAE